MSTVQAAIPVDRVLQIDRLFRAAHHPGADRERGPGTQPGNVPRAEPVPVQLAAVRRLQHTVEHDAAPAVEQRPAAGAAAAPVERGGPIHKRVRQPADPEPAGSAPVATVRLLEPTVRVSDAGSERTLSGHVGRIL